MSQISLPDVSHLPEDHPSRVPDYWVRAMLADAAVTPAARAVALKAAGLPQEIPADQPLWVTQRHEVVVVNALTQALGDTQFAARAGIALPTKQGSVLTYILFSAARLGDMLDLLARYLPITRTKSTVALVTEGDMTALKMWNLDPEISQEPAYHEFSMGAVLHLLRAAVGQATLDESVRFANDIALPPGDLARIYDCPVETGADTTALMIPTAALDLPLPSSDDHLLAHLTSYGDILLKRRRQTAPSVSDRIEAAVIERLPHGTPTLAQTARDLGLSTRTLSRRLMSEGKTYRDLLERLRFELAKSYLEDIQLPLAEIAFLLGFSDQSSFGTAFRRWCGSTPGQYRQAL